MYDTTISIARSLTIIAANALKNKIEDTVVIALFALVSMSDRACESRFTSTSGNIARWLHDIGVISISNKFDYANRLVADGLMYTVLNARRFELWSTFHISLDCLIELGIEATLKKNDYAVNSFSEKLGHMYAISNVYEVDVRFDSVESNHEGEAEYLVAFTEFKELYRQKKSL